VAWRAALLIEYDGSDFSGWQLQPRQRTVQGVLERALKTACGRAVRVTGAGRTDAGVHALGQVAHVDLPGSGAEARRLLAALNGLTPPSVVVRRVVEAPPGFHARHGATRRHYRYRLVKAPVACDRGYVWHVRAPIVQARLGLCAAALPGEHSFASFCVAKSASRDTRCRIFDAAWRRRGRELHFDIHANRFVHGMVRSLVGAMVQVAAGRDDVESFERRLQSGTRRGAGYVAPPHGLFLMSVVYKDMVTL